MPGLVKIGLTTRDNPIGRMKELFSTGVPQPFHCEAAWVVENAQSSEAQLHSEFAKHRVSAGREFFRVEASTVIQRLESIGMQDLTDRVSSILEVENDNAFRRPRQDWLHMGYEVGDRFYAGDSGEYVSVVDGRNVDYRGNIMSLSRARTIICEKFPLLKKDGEFHVNGKPVSERYDEVYGVISQS